eukprot:scaffold241878_cov18-Tisochrysis_lutea.AAC.1
MNTKKLNKIDNSRQKSVREVDEHRSAAHPTSCTADLPSSDLTLRTWEIGFRPEPRPTDTQGFCALNVGLAAPQDLTKHPHASPNRHDNLLRLPVYCNIVPWLKHLQMCNRNNGGESVRHVVSWEVQKAD